MVVPEQPQNLTTSKCSRLTRPLIAKIHSLTDLFAKDASLFDFDTEKCSAMPSKELLRFLNPKSSENRLKDLQPFILHDLYESYRDIFLNFKNIVNFVYQLNPKKAVNNPYNHQDSLFISNSTIPRLSTLSAIHTGKHIALGTKTTFLLVSQAMAFDKETFPAHLLMYSQNLEDGIESWLDMEPAPLFSSYRKTLLIGYLVHLLVINLSTLLYTLIPVIVHWLKEQGLPFLASLFYAYWDFLAFDVDLKVVGDLLPLAFDANKKTFWTFHQNGYWREFVKTLKLNNGVGRQDIYDPYDGLFLEAVTLNNKIDMMGIAEIYNVMRRNPQYHSNTSIIVIITADIIDVNYRQLKIAANSQDAVEKITASLSRVSELLLNWLAFNESCIFHHLDRGNERIFDSILHLLYYNYKHVSQVLHCLKDIDQTSSFDVATREFMNLESNLITKIVTIELLRSYHLDRPHLSQLQGISAERVVNYLWDLFGSEADDQNVFELVEWLHEQRDNVLTELAESISDQFSGQI